MLVAHCRRGVCPTLATVSHISQLSLTVEEAHYVLRNASKAAIECHQGPWSPVLHVTLPPLRGQG